MASSVPLRPPFGRRLSRAGAGRACVRARHLLAAIAVLVPWVAGANCFDLKDPAAARLEVLATRDARKAIDQAEQRRSEILRSAQADAHELAALYAVEANGYSLLDLDADARATALKGLALAPDRADPVHLYLLQTFAENQFDDEGLKNALVSVEDARDHQPATTPAFTCLTVTLGQIQHYQGRDDLAIVNLIQAYGATARPGLAPTRARAAAILSLVLTSMGDLDQALALNQDVIDWDTANGATQRLSESRYRRGEILLRKRDFAGALSEFGQVRQLSVDLHDQQGVGFADLRECETYLELGKIADAREHCTDSQQVFSDTHSTDLAKEARLLLARADLAEGRTWRALAILNGVLDHGGADLSQSVLTASYRLRAQANATLENYRDAYQDLNRYLQRYTTTAEGEKTRNAAALRARFGADREAEHNVALRHELALERERTDRQRESLRWAGATAVAALLVIALLSYVAVMNARNRRRLQELATIDGLTGLANRRRAAEVAIAELTAATGGRHPLTVALIDLDHFKVINDRCGHAAGDQVLRDFADLSRRLLPLSDTLGRWGGEEFLLVMPNTTLEEGFQRVEALRQAAVSIPLPASGRDLRVSLSAGLANHEGTGGTLDEIIARADVALYAAKNEGRDLVKVADPAVLETSSNVRRVNRAR